MTLNKFKKQYTQLLRKRGIFHEIKIQLSYNMIMRDNRWRVLSSVSKTILLALKSHQCKVFLRVRISENGTVGGQILDLVEKSTISGT